MLWQPALPAPLPAYTGFGSSAELLPTLCRHTPVMRVRFSAASDVGATVGNVYSCNMVKYAAILFPLDGEIYFYYANCKYLNILCMFAGFVLKKDLYYCLLFH